MPKLLLLSDKTTYQHYVSQQLYWFRTLFFVAGTVFGLFYSVFLYKSSFDIRILIVDNIFFAIAMWIGYIFGSNLISKFGYIKIIKLSALIFALASFITLYFSNDIINIFIFLALIRGFAHGIFMSVIDEFILREIGENSRKHFFFLSNSIQLVIGVVLPVIIGSLITFNNGSFVLTYVLSGLIYLLIIVLPFKHDKKPEVNFDLIEIITIIKQPLFKEYALGKIASDSAGSLNMLLFAIIPYLILQSEFQIGIIASISALIAALLSYYDNKLKQKIQIRLAYLGTILRILLNIFLAVSWTTPVLAIRSIFISMLSSFTDPVFFNIDLNNTKNILHKNEKKSTEVNVLKETCSLIGKISGMIFFLLLITYSGQSQENVIKVLIVLFGFWKLFEFIWMQVLNKKLNNTNLDLYKVLEKIY